LLQRSLDRRRRGGSGTPRPEEKKSDAKADEALRDHKGASKWTRIGVTHRGDEPIARKACEREKETGGRSEVKCLLFSHEDSFLSV